MKLKTKRKSKQKLTIRSSWQLNKSKVRAVRWKIGKSVRSLHLSEMNLLSVLLIYIINFFVFFFVIFIRSVL